MTRQRGAAAGRAHPAAAAPGPSRGEEQREQRQAGARAWPGESPRRRGRGLAGRAPTDAGGVFECQGGGGTLSGGRAPVVVCVIAPAVASLGWALHSPWHRPRGSGCAGLCACARVFVWRGCRLCLVCRWVVIVPAPGSGCRLPRRSPSCAGMCFLKQASCGAGLCCSPSGRGNVSLPQASRDLSGLGLQTDT